MITVCRYPIRPIATQELVLPSGAVFLGLGLGSENDDIFIFAKIDTENHLVKRHIRIVNTSYDLLQGVLAAQWNFIGTIVFEKTESEPRLFLHVFSD